MWRPRRPQPTDPCPPPKSPEETIRCEFRRIRRIITALGIAALLVLLSGGSFADYRSCRRSAPSRLALRDDARTVMAEARYWRRHGRPGLSVILDRRARALRVRALSCSRIPPGA